MAPYFTDYGDDDEEKKQKDPNSVQLASAGESAGPGGSQLGGLKSTQEVNSGSGFQNLDKYLSASKTGNFGSQFLDKAGAGVNQAYANKDAASEQFKKQVNQANTLPSQTDIESTIANPTEKGAADKYKGWLKDSYSGPTSLEDNKDVWNKYWGGINTASAPTEQLGTEHGRHALLDSYFGRPGYSSGEKNLDNLILSKQNLGKGIQDLQGKVSNLKASGKAGEEELNSFVGDRSAQVGQSVKDLRASLGLGEKNQVIEGNGAGAIGKEYANAEGRKNQLNDARKAEQASISQALSSGNLSPEQLAKLGLSGNEQAYNVDASRYLKNAGEISKEQALTPEMRIRIKALNGLAGLEDTYSGSEQPLDADYSFDANGFNTDVGARNVEYWNAIRGQKDALLPQLHSATDRGNDLNPLRNMGRQKTGHEVVLEHQRQQANAGAPDANSSPQQVYKFFKDYITKLDSGQNPYLRGDTNVIRNALAQYDATQQNFQPNRKVKV